MGVGKKNEKPQWYGGNHVATDICRKNKHPFYHFPTKMFLYLEKYGAKADRILKGINIDTQKTLRHVNTAFNKPFHLRGKIGHYR